MVLNALTLTLNKLHLWIIFRQKMSKHLHLSFLITTLTCSNTVTYSLKVCSYLPFSQCKPKYSSDHTHLLTVQ